MRNRLLPSERDLEQWFYEVQKEDSEAGSGVLVRCMVIASLHPDWSFFSVLDECKKSCQRRQSVLDILPSDSKFGGQ